MPSVLKPSHFAATTLALSLAAAGQAHASGFALMEQNASGLGNAYAGQAAAAEDASTIFFNPAGMTKLPGRQVVFGGNFISPRGQFDDDGSTMAPVQIEQGGEGGTVGESALVPHAYLSWQLSPQVWVGVGASVPFGLGTEYDNDWMGRFYATDSDVETLNINPSLAWKINDAVSLGFGVSLQKIETTLKSTVNLSGAVAANPLLGPGFLFLLADCPGAVPAGPFAGVGCGAPVKVDGDDWSWGWNIGATFDFSPSTRLGVAYRSKIKHDLEGDIRFSNVPDALAALAPTLQNAEIEAEVELPDSLTIAISHYFTPRLQLLADYTWTGWDSVKTISINNQSNGLNRTDLALEFEDSHRVGVGLNYQYDDDWKFRVGLAYDKTPVKDEFRTPRLPDEDRIWAAMGVQLRASQQAVLDFGYAFIHAPDDAEVDLDEEGSGNLRGSYDAKVHIFSAALRYSF